MNDLVQCVCCGQDFDYSLVTEIMHGDMVCQPCYQLQVIACELCGEDMLESDSCYLEDLGCVCQNCDESEAVG